MCGEWDGAGMRVLAVGGWGGGVVCGLGVGWVRVKVFCGGVVGGGGGLGTASFHGYIYFLVFSIFILLYRPWTDVCSIASIAGNGH